MDATRFRVKWFYRQERSRISDLDFQPRWRYLRNSTPCLFHFWPSSQERFAIKYIHTSSQILKDLFDFTLGRLILRALYQSSERANRSTENARTLYGGITNSTYESLLSYPKDSIINRNSGIYGGYNMSRFVWSCWIAMSWNG